MLHNIRVKELKTANNQERKRGIRGRGDIAGRKLEEREKRGGNPGKMRRDLAKKQSTGNKQGRAEKLCKKGGGSITLSREGGKHLIFWPKPLIVLLLS